MRNVWSPVYVVNFQDALIDASSAATTKPSCLINTIELSNEELHEPEP